MDVLPQKPIGFLNGSSSFSLGISISGWFLIVLVADHE
jgi:hypothetical protein